MQEVLSCQGCQALADKCGTFQSIQQVAVTDGALLHMGLLSLPNVVELLGNSWGYPKIGDQRKLGSYVISGTAIRTLTYENIPGSLSALTAEYAGNKKARLNVDALVINRSKCRVGTSHCNVPAQIQNSREEGHTICVEHGQTREAIIVRRGPCSPMQESGLHSLAYMAQMG